MFDDIYKDTEFRKLPNYGRKAGEHFAPHSRMGRQYPRFVEWGYHTEDSYQKVMRKYSQLIYGVDYSIGMVLEELERLGIEDNTVILFSSDNGYFCGSHGLGSKVLPYEEGARVPLIIYDPRHPKSGAMRRAGALSGNVDIAATILELAGVAVPDSYDGKSLMPVVHDEKNTVRDTLPVIQVWGPEATRCLSVIKDDHKYIYWYYENDEQNLKATEELYDLKNDPYELKNVAGEPDYQAVLDRMRKAYDSQVEHWKDQCVKYNGYPEYGTLFDRSMPWDVKAGLLKK